MLEPRARLRSPACPPAITPHIGSDPMVAVAHLSEHLMTAQDRDVAELGLLRQDFGCRPCSGARKDSVLEQPEVMLRA